MYKEFREQTVSLSTSPFVFSSGLLKFLNKYPHGCTEQITSKVLPLIALGDNSPNAFDRNEAFKIIIGKYRLRQLSSGGFSTWDNGSYVSEFNSMYALHFLTYAKKKGYNVPKDMLNDGLRWIRSYLNSDDDNSMWNAKIKAYGIYILTLNEEVTTGFILNLTNSLDARYQDSWKKSIASSYLAASYKLLHEDKMANELIKGYNFDRDIKQDERHYYYYSDFDTSFVNDAIYVNLVNSHFSDIIDLNNDKTISRILNPIIDDDYSTLLSSYSVLALSSFNENKSNEFDLKAYDKEGKEIALEKSDKSMFVTYELPKNVYKISSSKSDLYYVITSQGFEQNIISEKSSEGVEVTKEFYVDGKKVTKVKKGDEVEVLIKVRALNDKENYNMAIIDLVVGGFEIKTESFSSDEIEHKDLREDRALVYLTVDENVKEVRYKVKATSKGKFTIPPVYLKSLYNKYVNAVYVKEPYFEVE
ncbi:MAG: hypothetical protein BWY78_00333 [Alphaproteobacteria bacterium ADurb.Bin438]|nr:MAG: hypothetical protein BWY78_00333 [Alphaproteobacteria bacterium ADurb.Bin438]